MTFNLVTGADGFVGQHLVAELLDRGEEVLGAIVGPEPLLTTLSESEARRVRWELLELEEEASVRRFARAYRADRLFHLAGLSSPSESLDDPASHIRVNVLGSLFLLDELAAMRRESGYDPAIVISGSAHVYGAAAARFQPLIEEHPLEPLNPYAVSKAAQEMLGTQFARSAGLSVVVTRSFNHTGPGQRPTFVASQLAARVQAISQADGVGTVKVGDPTVRRDFTDVRDVVRAYIALSELGEPGCVYNVCSGRALAVAELLEMLARRAGVEVTLEPDPERARRVDVPLVVGSNARLAELTGWAPRIPIERSLADLLAWHAGR
ncbi:MAG: GDP-mannose 4,6-dehydratase [Gemmatimonadota bacterium]|nr:MAG: GDP-mannose 4,6-dehydratase [Gemmatimonadota bacterium]